MQSFIIFGSGPPTSPNKAFTVYYMGSQKANFSSRQGSLIKLKKDQNDLLGTQLISAICVADKQIYYEYMMNNKDLTHYCTQ